MSQANVQVIRGIYENFATGNIPDVLGAMDANIVWNEAENFVYADRNPYLGSQAILTGVFMRFGAEWDGFAATPNEILDAGDRVIVFGTYTATYRATGKAVRAQMMHDWTVKDGKAVRFQQYTDTKQFADAVTK